MQGTKRVGRHLLVIAWLGCGCLLWHTIVCHFCFFGGDCMSLFGDLKSYKVGSLCHTKVEKKKKQPTLIELAQEKFGDDKQLMMWIEGYIEQKREQHTMPTRLSWVEQLTTLEKHPKNERIKEVRRCIAGGYRQLAYEPKYKRTVDVLPDEEEQEEVICYDKAY